MKKGDMSRHNFEQNIKICIFFHYNCNLSKFFQEKGPKEKEIFFRLDFSKISRYLLVLLIIKREKNCLDHGLERVGLEQEANLHVHSLSIASYARNLPL